MIFHASRLVVICVLLLGLHGYSTAQTEAEVKANYTKLEQLIDEKTWDEIRSQRNELTSQPDAHIRFERDFVRPDGRKAWASIYARMLRDPSGEARFAVLQVLDLTEQRRAQRALAISESRFRGIIENTGEVTLVIDLEGRISYANPKAYEVFGASATSLIGAKPLLFIHAVDRNEFGRALARTNTRPRETFRLTDIRLQASDVYLDVQFTGLGDAPGISGTVVTARITTDQVKAEKQLRLSEAKFSTVFHSSPDAVLILRQSDSIVVDFNTGFTRLLGYTREEAIEKLKTQNPSPLSEAEREWLLKKYSPKPLPSRRKPYFTSKS